MNHENHYLPFWKVPLKGVPRAIALAFAIAFAMLCLIGILMAYQQGRNTKMAGQHAKVLTSLLTEYQCLSNVVAHGQSSGGGFMFVKGTLESQHAFDQLKQLIVSSSPPVRVVCHVKVTNSNMNWIFEP